MKTAREYITENLQTTSVCPTQFSGDISDIERVMKEYAKEVAWQTLKDASLRVKSNSALGDMITIGILETP